MHGMRSGLRASLIVLSGALWTPAKADEPAYALHYKFQDGETVRTQVTHVATSDTRIQGVEQTSRSRSVSTKQWRIVKIADNGYITFEHLVTDVDMWQHATGHPEIRYNGATDEQAPPEYEHVAKSLGKAIAQVTITPTGLVMAREGYPPGLNLGLGPIATPLPSEAVKVGAKWHIPSEISCRTEDGKLKRIKTQQRFQLESVKTGVARISVRTEVLTPVDDARIEAQLVQKVTNGEIKFDIDAGRIISKQMDWDEEVIGFNGAESKLQYLARFNEESLTDEPAATTAQNPAKEPAQPQR